MSYIHLDLASSQQTYRRGSVSGDVVVSQRSPYSTLLVLCDGIGHGIQAHIAAEMTASRLCHLIKSGFSLRESCERVALSMEDARGKSPVYSVFTVVRVLNNGEATVLSYDMPGALVISQQHAVLLEGPAVEIEKGIMTECSCLLGAEESLVVMSDGVTQAGMGRGLIFGWGTKGVVEYINTLLADGFPAETLPELVNRKSLELSGFEQEDDSTIVLLKCKTGNIVNVFTGPPLVKKDDDKIAAAFLAADGLKVVCGATTAEIVARRMGQPIVAESASFGSVAPPYFSISGIDLVTEGAITLNQVYHVIDADPDLFEMESGVTLLCNLLLAADRINFFIGQTANPAHKELAFRQRGILTRETIVPLLQKKLESMGKLVVVEYVLMRDEL